jgi:hypothetical protein
VRARCLAVAVLILTASSAAAEPASPRDPWDALPDVLDLDRERPVRDLRILTAGALAGIYTGFGTWAYFAWYHGMPTRSEFTVAGDGYFGQRTYAGGADKLGHLWINLVGTRLGARLLRAGGWPRDQALLISAGLATAFFTVVEAKDGYYYQLSPGDLIGNLVGVALGAALERWPRLDALVDFRVEYWPSREYRAIVRGDAEAEINTLNIAEDYSGQTYLTALHLGAVGRLGRWSRYVDVVAGFGSDHYKPDPIPAEQEPRTQRVFLGVSLNAQGVVDDLLRGPLRAAGHGVFEVMNAPYTSLPVADLSRSPDRPAVRRH